MSANHADRAHATWGASATHRNWNCPGALILSKQVAHLDKESEAAAWGTACHEVSEMCLKGGHDAVEFVDRVIKTKEHEIEVDEELAETAQTYIDYVRGRGGKLQIEQRFSLDKIKPPFDAGGTADAVIYFPSEKLLEVIDLKGGRGVVVEVADNKQLRTYALGAILASPGLDVDRVMSTVVQPRAGHKDGRIRSETYHVTDLMDWTGELIAAMKRADFAANRYTCITGAVSREEWADQYLKPGGWCTFCPAAGTPCPALEKQAVEKAGLYFDDLDAPKLANTPADLSPERLAQMLAAEDMVAEFFKACRRMAQSLAESGVDIPGHVLVEKTGRRRWVDETAVVAAADMLGIDDLYVEKLKSPAQLEKTLGKDKHLIADLIETPVTGRSLVRKDKTTRKAVAPAAHQHLTVLE
jgi:hypothetical protein